MSGAYHCAVWPRSRRSDVTMADEVLWSGRFGMGPERSTIEFTSSFGVDVRLAWYDVMGSLAHARMLVRQRIIPSEDGDLIIDGLRQLLAEIEKGEIELDKGSEDVHSAVELLLTKRIGEAGGKLHTGRSRNDQVVTDLRMFMRDATLDTMEHLIGLQLVLMDQSERHKDTLLPGFTHMQHAQPVTLGFHLMAYVFKLQRDIERMQDSYRRVNVCPLGAAALAGTTYGIDRHTTATMLGFERPGENAMDCVTDRDFVLEYCFAAATIMTHLSSLSEELVLWSSPEFGFVEIGEGFSTGSSIMPQKKNPDVAELIRGRTGRSIGSLMAMLTLVKGLPMAYNRDLQEDKEGLFRTYENVTSCLRMMASMLADVRFRSDNMALALKGGFLNATDLADYLVTKGVPFRKAHEIVGQLVRHCIEEKKGLEDLTLDEMSPYSPFIGQDAMRSLGMRYSVERRASYGGTAPDQVEKQIEMARGTSYAKMSSCQQERDRLIRTWNDLTYGL
jgi:argininosuccinate lyase